MKMSEIINMGKNGATYQEIANAVGVSRQRVNQIIMEHAPELKGTRGSARRNALDLINHKDAEIERYKGVIKLIENDVLTAKSEAVKEFAERLETALDERVSEKIRERNPHWYLAKRIVRETAIEMTEVSK